MKRKKFCEDYDPFGHYHQRDQFMIFYLGTADNIVGFTKQKRYSYGEDHNIDIDDIDTMQCSGVESVLHANTIPISAETLDIEMMWAAEARPFPLELPGDVELWPPSMGRWPLLHGRSESSEDVVEWSTTIVEALQPAISTLSTTIEGLNWH